MQPPINARTYQKGYEQEVYKISNMYFKNTN